MTSSSGSSRPDRHTIRLWASNDSMRVYGVLAIVLLVGVALRCWDLARAPHYFADEVFAAVSAHNLVLNGTDLTGSIAHPLSYISDVLNGDSSNDRDESTGRRSCISLPSSCPSYGS